MPSPGDVVILPIDGAVQGKVRPAVVLSSATYHATRPDLVVGVLTTKLSKATAPTDYHLIDWQSAGLHKASAFRAYLSTDARTEVLRTIGRLSDRDWQAVRDRVRLALDIC